VRFGEKRLIDAYAERWALVTGASSGIGAEFAEKLAARGMHLVLTARRQQRMEKLAEDLHTKHGAKSVIIPGDLASPKHVRKIVKEINRQNIEIELLVNNAGFAVVAEVEATSLDRVKAMLELNVRAVTELTYLLLPEMMKRGHGAIVNVSSVAGFQPVAYMGAYAASKAYILHFSEALWAEAIDQNVTVMALCPGVTETEFFEVAGVSGWLKKQQSQTPEQVVRSALKALDKRKPCKIPGFKNKLLAFVTRFVTRKATVNGSRKYFRPRPKKEKSEKPENKE